MSTLKVDTIKNGAGTREYFPCSAWVNFNGTGTVAIRDSGNVSSITDNGEGDYTVNFTTAMADANYSLSGSTPFDATNRVVASLCLHSTVAPSTTSVRVGSTQGSTASVPGKLSNVTYVNVTIHGGI